MSDFAESKLMDSIMGRTLLDWHIGEDGMHIELDDGRVLILAGMFVMRVMEAEESRLH